MKLYFERQDDDLNAIRGTLNALWFLLIAACLFYFGGRFALWVVTPEPPVPVVERQVWDREFFDHNRLSVGWDLWQCKVTKLEDL